MPMPNKDDAWEHNPIGTITDMLSEEEVCPGLATEDFGRRGYYYYQEIDSTNNCAKNLAAQGAPEGTVVAAEKQTAGRGRSGRTWYSPANQGLYVSVIMRPVLPVNEISRISLITALAVTATLQSVLNLEAQIKWPNDILINNKKIAGILSEVVTNKDGVEFVVVGIGLNINNDVGEFPDDLRMPATSVLTEHKCLSSRIKVLQVLLANLERYYKQLLAGNFAACLEIVRSLSMLIGAKVRLDAANGQVEGIALDIDESGCLVVRDHDGTIHTIMSGEITALA